MNFKGFHPHRCWQSKQLPGATLRRSGTNVTVNVVGHAELASSLLEGPPRSLPDLPLSQSQPGPSDPMSPNSRERRSLQHLLSDQGGGKHAGTDPILAFIPRCRSQSCEHRNFRSHSPCPRAEFLNGFSSPSLLAITTTARRAPSAVGTNVTVNVVVAFEPASSRPEAHLPRSRRNGRLPPRPKDR